MIDTSKIRIGDKISFEYEVTAFCVDRRFAEARGADGDLSILRLADAVTHTPKPREFRPGDSVVFGFIINDKIFGKILCIDDGVAWVKWPNGVYQNCHIDELSHVDESE